MAMPKIITDIRDLKARVTGLTSEIVKIKDLGKGTVTLRGASWISNTQTVNISIVNSTCTVIVSPAPAYQNEYSDSNVRCISQGEGTLTFSCEKIPTSDLVVNIVTL